MGQWSDEPYVNTRFAGLRSWVLRTCIWNCAGRTSNRPVDSLWPETVPGSSAVSMHYSRDPFVQRVFGEFVARLAAVEALADRWNARFDELIARGSEVASSDRAAAEVGIAQLKIPFQPRPRSRSPQRVYEVHWVEFDAQRGGPGSVLGAPHPTSLHDPIDYKKLEVGAHSSHR